MQQLQEELELVVDPSMPVTKVRTLFPVIAA